ncbi:MAG: UDP-N-acetylmuramoyl-L-alanine--D-glutamate ligase [Acidobacteriota bacterium]|nr:UDP-N-acetylmuramoyl-L-alanine--D-glutamate ligase [Blastocatellia bacterium]MDW8412264.1 UDP-N-acetylmuramoyl-L-alanine--D-glutamate ligase [Acidobacteriota bacterium]
MELSGKRVTVVGIARSGCAAAKFLARQGADVTVSDAASAERLAAQIEQLQAFGVKVEAGVNSEQTLLDADLIVLSPGVPLTNPAVAKAIAVGKQVIGEVELAARFLKGTLIGITGSNGKTTTTALTAAILRKAGLEVLVGGNIGTPLVDLVERSTPESVVVAELSSFQLETVEKLHLRVAALLNVTPNHLDRYTSFEQYAQAKSRVFVNQTNEDFAVLNAESSICVAMSELTPARKLFFSVRRELEEGVFLRDEQLILRFAGREYCYPRSQILLRGLHNVENVCAAMAIGVAIGAEVDRMWGSVQEFLPVEHRLEPVDEIRGVHFVNDSKATSVDAAMKALEIFSDVVLILGGKDKGSDYSLLRRLVAERARAVVLIGSASEKIAEALAGTVELVRSSSMYDAVEKSFALARPGDTVLLSPACASFDMFDSFEHRGNVFKEAVRRLKARLV